MCLPGMYILYKNIIIYIIVLFAFLMLVSWVFRHPDKGTKGINPPYERWSINSWWLLVIHPTEGILHHQGSKLGVWIPIYIYICVCVRACVYTVIRLYHAESWPSPDLCAINIYKSPFVGYDKLMGILQDFSSRTGFWKHILQKWDSSLPARAAQCCAIAHHTGKYLGGAKTPRYGEIPWYISGMSQSGCPRFFNSWV